MSGSQRAQGVQMPAQPPPGFWVAAVVAIAGQMGLLVGAPSAPAAGGERE